MSKFSSESYSLIGSKTGGLGIVPQTDSPLIAGSGNAAPEAS